jgi:antitoxin HigA-1
MLLEEFIKPLGLTQREVAKRLGISYPRLNELIRARRGMTADTAMRLEQLFGLEAQAWMNMQLVWDLYHARRSESAKAIRKIHRLPALRRAS